MLLKKKNPEITNDISELPYMKKSRHNFILFHISEEIKLHKI